MSGLGINIKKYSYHGKVQGYWTKYERQKLVWETDFEPLSYGGALYSVHRKAEKGR